jgi:ABC-type multidrug transport system ATPase subunit
MLSLLGVDKEFDFRLVLKAVTITLEPGRVYALRAPNGSGKTTLLRVMAGLTRPTRGQVLWQGRPISARARRHLGVVLEKPLLYGEWTAAENLTWFARLYDCPEPSRTARQWLKATGLDDLADLPVRDCSKGQRQRLAIARACLHNPEVLLFDEPFDGLDEDAQAWGRRLLRALAADGKAVFVVTHQTDDWERADVRLTLCRGSLEVVG